MPHSHSALTSAYLDALTHIARSCWNISNAFRIPEPLFPFRGCSTEFQSQLSLSLRKRTERLLWEDDVEKKRNTVIGCCVRSWSVAFRAALRKNLFFFKKMVNVDIYQASLCLSNSHLYSRGSFCLTSTALLCHKLSLQQTWNFCLKSNLIPVCICFQPTGFHWKFAECLIELKNSKKCCLRLTLEDSVGSNWKCIIKQGFFPSYTTDWSMQRKVRWAHLWIKEQKRNILTP